MELPLIKLLEHPTVSALAAHLGEGGEGGEEGEGEGRREGGAEG